MRTKERQKWGRKGAEATGKEKEEMRKETEGKKKGRKKEGSREEGRKGTIVLVSSKQYLIKK